LTRAAAARTGWAMKDEGPTAPPPARPAGPREARLAQALRANLRRRKIPETDPERS
jgi:hypothetical protein